MVFNVSRTTTRSSHQRWSAKKDLLEISQNSQENPSVRVSFYIKFQTSGLIPRLWQGCFPENFAKHVREPFLRNTSGRLLLNKSSYIREISYIQSKICQNLHYYGNITSKLMVNFMSELVEIAHLFSIIIKLSVQLMHRQIFQSVNLFAKYFMSSLLAGLFLMLQWCLWKDSENCFHVCPI